MHSNKLYDLYTSDEVMIKLLQFEVSILIMKTTITKVSTMTDESTMTDDSTMTDESAMTNESAMSDDSSVTNESTMSNTNSWKSMSNTYSWNGMSDSGNWSGMSNSNWDWMNGDWVTVLIRSGMSYGGYSDSWGSMTNDASVGSGDDDGKYSNL